MNTHYGTAKLPILIVEWSLCFVCLFVTIPISGRIQPNENQNHRTTQIPTSTGKRTVSLFPFRPDFFYFMVYRLFWALFNVGIRNKNKNKISVMSDMHWWSLRLLSNRKPIFAHTKQLTI